jgi:circadian clock protein KaiC
VQGHESAQAPVDGPYRGPAALAQRPTGIAGLDQILRGGLPVGGAYLVAGTPGTGKTTLGNQLAYAHAAGGGVSIIATLVAETHDRMLAHLVGFAFIDPAQVGVGVHYLSLVSSLEEGGLDGVLTAIRDLVRGLGATLLVVDGTGLLEDVAPSTLDFRQFTAQLQAHSALLGCTTLLLTNRRAEQTDEIATHVDGVVHLLQESVGAGERRLLRVPKLRGVGHLTGRHEFAITTDGIVVSPRLVSLMSPRDHRRPRERAGQHRGAGTGRHVGRGSPGRLQHAAHRESGRGQDADGVAVHRGRRRRGGARADRRIP